MNNVEFISIEGCNVKCIGYEPVKIVFDQYRGFTYVLGDNQDFPGLKNGVGKTAILGDLLLLGLYGRFSDKANNRDVFNRTSDPRDKGYVIVELEVNNKDRYRIEVEIKSNKKRDKCSIDHLIYKNGNSNPISLSSKADTLSFIQDHVIGCSFDIFKNSIILSSNNLINFFKLDKSEKKKYLEGVFNLSAFGVAYKKVNEKYNETRKNIKNFSIELEDIISDIDDLNRKSNNYVASQDNKKQNIKKTISEIRKEARDEPQCPDTPKNYEKIMSVLGKEEIIQNKIDKLNKDYRLQTTQLIKVESNIEYNSKLIKNNQHIIDAVCKDCKNNIEKIFKIDIALQEISENTTKNESIKSTVSDIEDELIDLKNKNAKIKKAKEIVRKYESSLNRYKLEKKEYDNFAEKNKLRIDMLKQQYKSISEEDNPFLSIITKNEEKQININEKLNNALNYQAYYDTLRKIFGDSGAKVDVISDIISALNSRIKYYLQKMGANYTVLFDSSFEYEFITESGNCGYSAFSSGEQKRIELATLFSFRDVLMVNSLNTNIFVVDEILDSAIDTFALQAIVNDLKQKSKNTNIFLISHRETLLDNKDLFDNIMKIQKYNRQITVSRE